MTLLFGREGIQKNMYILKAWLYNTERNFPNSLSEKNTNDIPIQFAQCHLSVTALKSWNLFKNHSCEAKDYFHEMDILQDSEPPHKKTRTYCVCNQVMQYTDLNNGCLNRKRQCRV